MYITPNSTLRVLHNIDIDPDYENTLYFANLNSQTSYFANNAKYTFPAQTYQRVNKNVVRVNRKADDLYDCCYMMFQNTSYGNKWFYAFIDSVEYVNDITSNIYYTIDDMQTWLKDWTFKSCFVERMHTITDEIGDNIVPENIETGEIVMNNDYLSLREHTENGAIDASDVGSALVEPWIILGVVDVQQAADGNVYDRTYSGAKLFCYPAIDPNNQGIRDLNAKLTELNVKPDAVVTMFMCPKFCLGENPTSGSTPSFSSNGYSKSFTMPQLAYPLSLNGYQPKNRKLYTYPFNYLHIDDGAGNSLNLRYEFFYDLTPMFLVESTLSQPVQISLRPFNYKGVKKYTGNFGSIKTTLNTECLTLNGYPMCSWNMDSWKAWVAQNSLPLVTKTLTSAIIGGMIGADATMISQGMGTLTDIYQASIKADISRGNFNNGGVNWSHLKQTFFIGRASVNKEMARIIDSYFDKYGYAIKRTLVPTITSRPYWNYLKTVKCFIDGNIPSDAKKHICSIFDKGITFWHDPSTMGMYSLNNAPVQATP